MLINNNHKRYNISIINLYEQVNIIQHSNYKSDCVKQLIIASGILNSAPFSWIILNYHYTQKTDLKPEFRRISKKTGELPMAIELDVNILKWSDDNNLHLFVDMFMIGALEALISMCKKYKLDDKLFVEERGKFREHIPETIEECEQLPTVTIEDYKHIRQYFRYDINICSNCHRAKRTVRARQCLGCGEFHEPLLMRENGEIEEVPPEPKEGWFFPHSS